MNEHFALYEAAIHVFNEAYRVNHFINICQSSLSDSAKIKVIGELMNQSQSSCRDLYNCSCPEID